MQPPQQPWSPFDPRPNDDDPIVAKTRYRVLREFMSTGDYAKHDPAWRSLVDQTYLAARQAAGIQTIAEQQAAQQQQMQMQAEQQGADKQSAHADEKQQDQAFQSQENDKNRAAKMAA
jgi:hypothetical protein